MIKTRMAELLEEEYFEWLLNKYIAPTKDPINIRLKDLYRLAYQTTFMVIIPFDNNRLGDVDEIRTAYNVETYKFPCINYSLLEVMISLALRLNNLVYNADNPIRTHYWVYKMVENLGLNTLTNEVMDSLAEQEAKEAFQLVVNRKYFPDGYGGLFPLRKPQRDQAKVELWLQMMSWIQENYPV